MGRLGRRNEEAGTKWAVGEGDGGEDGAIVRTDGWVTRTAVVEGVWG